MENKLNWLAYHSGILTERFQKRHLIVNYSLLALALLLYGIGLAGTWIIVAACLPGAAIFIISLEALAWKRAIEGDDILDLIRQIR